MARWRLTSFFSASPHLTSSSSPHHPISPAARVAIAAAVLVALGVPRAAEAQWYAGVYMGANTTAPADVRVQGPGYDITFRDVSFDAESFTSPQYYGYRIGRFFDGARRLGAEFEFIHLKVIGHPADLGPEVTRYQMTHGLNFLLVNFVARIPLGRSAYGDPRFALVSRAGAGITLPHAETTVFGESQEQYEYAGPGSHAAAGFVIKLKGRLAMTTEYKITYARPKISLANGGTGHTTSLSHHVAVGFTFGISR